ncbi:recombinase family protein [Paenibacillus sp. LjRoot56]|uniref:recombinase family protein n=1 Tax=Paenibacillus sp. LjRoot56 TaxID=3342333 RepID=UPI003ECEDDCB
MRVISYIRVSTEDQAEKGNSLTEQQERLTAYCVAMGWPPPAFIIDDGYSAKNLNRPGITEMIKRVERKEVDIILTSKLDRLCRNLLDLLQIIQTFSKYGCSYVSSSESFDTSTAVGRMTLQLLGTFAEFERERISERVHDNMVSIARNTDKALGKPCYGYDIIDGMYVINEDEAANVRYMFDMAEQGQGHRMIAKHLNLKGVLTKQGKPWDQINVKRLMKTETIAGIRIFNKRKTEHGKTVLRDQSEWIIKDDNHPAIIDPERYEKAQDIISSRSKARSHADNETYLLTGLVKCKYCGGGMKGATNRHKTKYNDYTYHRYICSSYVLGYGCRHHAVHRGDLEDLIIGQIKWVASATDKELNIKVAAANVDTELKEIKAQLAKLDKQMQKQLEAYTMDLITAQVLKMATDKAEADRAILLDQLTKLENQNGNASNVQNNAMKLLEDITGDDRMKAKAAIRLLIDSVIVEGEEISVTWKP